MFAIPTPPEILSRDIIRLTIRIVETASAKKEEKAVIIEDIPMPRMLSPAFDTWSSLGTDLGPYNLGFP